jgi:hypothetical protein
MRSPRDAEKLLRTLAACESGSACLDKYGLRHAERLRKEGLRYCGITLRAAQSSSLDITEGPGSVKSVPTPTLDTAGTSFILRSEEPNHWMLQNAWRDKIKTGPSGSSSHVSFSQNRETERGRTAPSPPETNKKQIISVEATHKSRKVRTVRKSGLVLLTGQGGQFKKAFQLDARQ